MATIKNRLNISLSPDIDKALSGLSRRDNMPRATKATELLRIALELEEDQVWDKRADVRDTESARFMPHRLAWK